MKRLLLITVVLLVQIQVVVSQGVELGISSGLTHYFKSGSQTTYDNAFSHSGFDLGIFFAIPVKSELLYFQPEIVLTKRTTEHSTPGIRVYSQSVEIPLMFSLMRKSSDKISFYASAGPNLIATYKQVSIPVPNFTLPSTIASKSSFGDIYKIGLLLELGVRCDFSDRDAFVAGIRAGMDLGGRTKDKIDLYKFNTATFRAGYIFKF